MRGLLHRATRRKRFKAPSHVARIAFLSALAICSFPGTPSPAAESPMAVVTEIPPFTGSRTESFEEFPIKKFGSEQVPIFGGTAVLAGTNLETDTFHMFRLCSYFAGPSDGTQMMGADMVAAYMTVTFSQPVSAFGAYWSTIPEIPEGCRGSGVRFRFLDAAGNEVGQSFRPSGHGGPQWYGYAFTTPVKSIVAAGYYLVVDAMQANPFIANSLSNISTRLRVETGDNVPIGGFIVIGSSPKKIVLRGIGPSLTGFGISDALGDPTLELHDATGALLLQNDNWQDDPSQASQLNALSLAPRDPKESAMIASLQPAAAYTAILTGKNSDTGIGLIEIYDVDPGASSQLANISTRGFVQTGTKVMIGGFILGGGNGASVAVRGIGPSLSQAGLSNQLNDPVLELHDSNGALLVSNDNWGDDSNSAAQLSTHGLALQNPLESGIFTSLPAGAFTAILAGKDGGTGIGLVEVYNVP